MRLLNKTKVYCIVRVSLMMELTLHSHDKHALHFYDVSHMYAAVCPHVYVAAQCSAFIPSSGIKFVIYKGPSGRHLGKRHITHSISIIYALTSPVRLSKAYSIIMVQESTGGKVYICYLTSVYQVYTDTQISFVQKMLW